MRIEIQPASREQDIRSEQHDDTNGKNINSLWQSHGYGTVYKKPL
jgi:hypothetical protein